MLATAGDDGNVLLWVPSETHNHTPAFGEEGLEDKETWRVKHMCRSFGSEIYDLAWSPDGVFFITGSMDNIARIYNAHTGKRRATPTTSHSLISIRANGTTDCRAQSLCSGCCMGSIERVCGHPVIRSFRSHLQPEDQGWPVHPQSA